MRQFQVVVSVACLLAALAGPVAAAGPAASKKAALKVVKASFENISNGKAELNQELFVRQDATVVGISGGAGAETIWQKKASEVVDYWKKVGPLKHTVDLAQASLLDDALAVVRARFHTDDVKCRAVFTLTSEGGKWRIASLVYETRLP